MTSHRAELLKTLGRIQNHPVHAHTDIMTITGFMNDAEVEKHIEVSRTHAVDADAVAFVAKALGVKLSHGMVA